MKKFLLLTFGILMFSVWINAQVPVNEAPPLDAPPYDAPPDPVGVRPIEVYPLSVTRETVYDPPPVTVRYSPDVFGELRANTLPGSFAHDAAWSLQNNFGFSLGAQEGYYFGDNSQSSSATSLSAGVFTNYSSGKSAMHLDYGTDYSFYPERQNSADDINHSVNAAYVYRFNNRASFQLRDQFTSSSNDPLSDLFSINASSGRLMAGSYYYDLILSPQRYTRNTVTTSLSADVTGKGTNLNIFGSYENYWYGDQSSVTGMMKDFYSATIGARINQRITSWMSLGTSYSLQLNDDLKENQAHRVEIGRFQFDLSPNVQVYASGGVVITDSSSNNEGYRVNTQARTGISWSTEIARLYAEYSRTMISVSGYRRLLPSDTFLAGLGAPIGDRVNVRVSGYYQRSSDSLYSGRLNSYTAQASMEYLLVPGLAASGNYTYRYQKNSISSLGTIPYAERSTISGGLRYNWPSRRR